MLQKCNTSIDSAICCTDEICFFLGWFCRAVTLLTPDFKEVRSLYSAHENGQKSRCAAMLFYFKSVTYRLMFCLCITPTQSFSPAIEKTSEFLDRTNVRIRSERMKES